MLTGQGFVVDRNDRIVQVDHASRTAIAPYLGHSLWTYVPEARPLLRPYLAEARETGAEVESTIFYAGATRDVRVVPVGACLAVRLERRTELDLRILETLAASLRSIEAEIAARAPVRRDRPAPASPQALP
jgi:hypothetical protein